MKGLRILNNGRWNKPPVLTAARRVLMSGLGARFDTCSLGEAASFLNGTSYDVNQLCDIGGVPIIRISNITDPSSSYLRTAENLSRRFWVMPSDLLVSWSASFKSIIWQGPAGYLNQHIFKVTERPGFDRRFIRHAIEASFDEMQDSVVGIGMMHLRRADFLRHPLPAPPLQLQMAVADYLDFMESGQRGEKPALPLELMQQNRVVAQIEELAAQINEARELRRQAAEETDALLHSALSAVCKGSFSRVVPLGEAIGKGSLRNGKSVKPAETGDGIRCLTLSAMRQGRIDMTSTKAVPLTLSEAQPFLAKRNDVFIVRGNGSKDLCGLAGRVEKEEPGVIFPDLFIHVPLPADQLLPEYFVAVWNSPVTREAIEEKAKTTSGIWKINQGHIMSTPIPIPPLSEQRRIVAELDALRAEVDALKRLQTETATELNALLPSVLDRAFKGGLGS